MISDPGMGHYSPRVQRDLDAVPSGNTRWLNEPQPISNQPMGLGFPHRAGQYRPGGSPFFVPGLSELLRYGRISHPGMGPYPPRVRRDLDVGPRGNSRRSLAP